MIEPVGRQVAGDAAAGTATCATTSTASGIQLQLHRQREKTCVAYRSVRALRSRGLARTATMMARRQAAIVDILNGRPELANTRQFVLGLPTLAWEEQRRVRKRLRAQCLRVPECAGCSLSAAIRGELRT